jgi:RHS repeat-associated protein
VVRSYVWGPDVSGAVGAAGGVGGLLAVRLHDGDGSVACTCFVARDAAGNVTALVDAETGDVLASVEYGPFGAVLAVDTPAGLGCDPHPAMLVNLCPFLFSTKYYDAETGLYYYGYRYYDPAAGKWLNRDPLAESGGLNLYGFCHNDPTNSIDPLGLEGRGGASFGIAGYFVNRVFGGSSDDSASATAANVVRASGGAAAQFLHKEDIRKVVDVSTGQTMPLAEKAVDTVEGAIRLVAVTAQDPDRGLRAFRMGEYEWILRNGGLGGYVFRQAWDPMTGLDSVDRQLVEDSVNLQDVVVIIVPAMLEARGFSPATKVFVPNAGDDIVKGAGLLDDGATRLLDDGALNLHRDVAYLGNAPSKALTHPSQFRSSGSASVRGQAWKVGPIDRGPRLVIAKHGFGPEARGSQLPIDEIIARHPALRGIRFTVYPQYDPGLPFFGTTARGGGQAPQIMIGPKSFISQSELVDTLVHEELHVRIYLRGLRGSRSALAMLVDEEMEHAWIGRVLDRFAERHRNAR